MLIHALMYWYVKSASRFYTAFQQAESHLEASFAVRDMLRNLDKPLFQDYTLQGRVIGVAIRLFRVALGLAAYAFAAALYLAGYVLWLLFPLLCLANLLGSLIGPIPAG